MSERVPGGRTLLRCYSYLRPYWPRCLGGLAGMLLADGVNLLSPQLIRAIFDRGISVGDLRLIATLVGVLVGLALLRGIFTFLQGRWIEQASQGVAYDLRNVIQDRLSALSFAFHDTAETGQLLSRAVQDVDRIRFLTGRASFRLLDSSVFALATLAMLLAMNVRLALAAMGMLPLLVLTALRFGSRQRGLSRDIQEQLGVLTSRIEQGLRGIRIVRAFAQEEAEIDRFEAENGKWRTLSDSLALNGSVFAPLLILVANLGVVFTVWYGGRLVMAGGLSLGELVAFSAYLGQLVGPVRLLGMIAPAIAVSVSSGERIFEILDARSEVTEAPDAAPLADPRGRVEFENVSFAYFHRFTVLHDVSFTVEPGQVVALLGATGSGKSTIINLVPRFYDVTGGRILVDGRDVRSLTLASLRGAIGIVLQETTLFAATVRENILFGVDGAGEDDLVRAARRAQAHDFIVRMPDGYDTRVGERGATLSGGQKQRIAIARALVKDPRILILDDATSSVDAVTEREIQTALDELMRDRTTFVIAHRLGTIRRADVILVLEAGRIVARGTHEDLLGMSPMYAEVFARQALGAGSGDGQPGPGGAAC
ncbi:MAG: ABC transporter ATP-binding protein [Spirochaetes bacterium]|nr:ABC transporter ATP-binding protein [Spirochaetota bacterium]